MKVIIHTLDGVRIEETNNIICCKADGNLTKIFIFHKNKGDNKKYFVSKKLLKEIELELPKPDFYRCHKSSLINLKYFFKFNVNKNMIILEDGTEIKISREKKAESKERLIAYIKKYNSSQK